MAMGLHARVLKGVVERDLRMCTAEHRVDEADVYAVRLVYIEVSVQ